MHSTLTLEKDGNWRLRLTAETDAERLMIATLAIPYSFSSGKNAGAFLEASPASSDGKHDTIVVEVQERTSQVVTSR